LFDLLMLAQFVVIMVTIIVMVAACVDLVENKNED